MKLKNILDASAEVLCLQEASFPILKRCANLVLASIATNYRDCEAKQTFDVKDCKIEYKDFDKTFLRIKNVCANGLEADYSLFIDFVQVPNGKVEVTYNYVPIFDEDLQCEISIPNLSEQTFIYGVITEYALISGMFNEAKVWNEKFEAGLFHTDLKNKNLKITAPRW